MRESELWNSRRNVSPILWAEWLSFLADFVCPSSEPPLAAGSNPALLKRYYNIVRVTSGRDRCDKVRRRSGGVLKISPPFPVDDPRVIVV